ncbi:MAG: hypothetical protein D6767_03470, partial [Candidatus Hydrogenedentota bacterium]
NDCSVDRGPSTSTVDGDPDYIFIMNHFKTATLGGGDKGWAQDNNKYGPLWYHVYKCYQERNKIPAMITVDWANYAYSDLQKVADDINAIQLSKMGY